MSNIRFNFIKIILFLSLCINAFGGSYLFYSNYTPKQERIILKEKKEFVTIPKYMSDWDMFTMALIKVESDYDSLAVSSAGAKGYFQITPIYIKEVNNIHKTNFTMEDVINLETAYQIFDLMQQAHNQDYNMDKAIILHNGKHEWYRRRVMNAYEDVKKYEEIRNRILEVQEQ